MLKNRKHSPIAASAAALLLALSLAGCAAGSNVRNSTAAAEIAPGAVMDGARADYGGMEEVAYDDAEPQDYEANTETGGSGLAGGDGVVVQNSNGDRKIVITMDLALQTKEFDAGTKDITATTDEFGGYIQDSYVEGRNLYDKYLSRSASYTVRVPVEKLGAFLQSLGNQFNVVSQRQSSNDISMGYYDTKARLESLRVQEERLMAMLDGATELQYMLEVERELANVLYEIESMTSSLNRMDDSVDLSTVTIHLQEVVEYEEQQASPASFGERIQYAFGDSWKTFVNFCQGAVICLIALIPFLPLIAVVVVVIVLLVRRSRKKRAARIGEHQNYPPVYQMPAQPPAPPQEEPAVDDIPDGPEDPQ